VRAYARACLALLFAFLPRSQRSFPPSPTRRYHDLLLEHRFKVCSRPVEPLLDFAAGRSHVHMPQRSHACGVPGSNCASRSLTSACACSLSGGQLAAPARFLRRSPAEGPPLPEGGRDGSAPQAYSSLRCHRTRNTVSLAVGSGTGEGAVGSDASQRAARIANVESRSSHSPTALEELRPLGAFLSAFRDGLVGSESVLAATAQPLLRCKGPST
jgi:hypothetical protein